MKSHKEQHNENDVPQLRVFRGDDERATDDPDPSNPSRQALRAWAQREAFWAGRNRAKRLSARLVA
jgi:hypothetical protein